MIYRDKNGKFCSKPISKSCPSPYFVDIDLSLPKPKLPEPSRPKNPTYMLRTCKENLSSRNEFQYPKEGFVQAPDWNPEPICGYGLHGLLMGKGDYYLCNYPKWMIVEIDPETVVKISDDKIKVPYGWVVFVGKKQAAFSFLLEKGAKTEDFEGQEIFLEENQEFNAGNRAKIWAANNTIIQADKKHKIEIFAKTGYSLNVLASNSDYFHIACGGRADIKVGNNAVIENLSSGVCETGEHSRISIMKHLNCCSVKIKVGKESIVEIFYYDPVSKEGKIKYFQNGTYFENMLELKADTWYEVWNGNLIEIIEPKK